MNLIYICLLIFLIDQHSAHSQAYIEWAARYNGGYGRDAGFAVTTDDSGYVYVTGFSYRTFARRDLIVLKYSPAGEAQWIKKFSEHSDDLIGNSIHIGSDNNLYVTGTKTLKLNLSGDTVWYLNASGMSVIDSLCNIYLAGGTGTQMRTQKYTTNGNFVWENFYQYQNYMYNAPRDIILDNEGNVIITGQSQQTESTYAFATIKYSNNGNELWVRRHNEGLSGYSFALDCDPLNNIYVTGRLQSNTIDILTIKYSPSGDTLWKKIFDSGGGDAGYDIAVDSLGNSYIAGFTAGANYVTVKYDTYGNFLWSRVQLYGDILGVFHPKIKLDSDGNVYMAFHTRRPSNHTNYAIVKYNPEGVQQWLIEYNNNNNSFDHTIYGLHIDRDSNVYVTGHSGVSIATIKIVQGIVNYIDPKSGYNLSDYNLYQNFPNPFNPITTIKFSIPKAEFVTLKVYDLLGREIETIISEHKQAGTHIVNWNAHNISSGVYYYNLTVGNPSVGSGQVFSQTRKMILLR
jgi:hypothetical protein